MYKSVQKSKTTFESKNKHRVFALLGIKIYFKAIIMEHSRIYQEPEKYMYDIEKKAQIQSHRHMGAWYITEMTSQINEAKTDCSVTDIGISGSLYGKKSKLGPSQLKL